MMVKWGLWWRLLHVCDSTPTTTAVVEQLWPSLKLLLADAVCVTASAAATVCEQDAFMK